MFGETNNLMTKDIYINTSDSVLLFLISFFVKFLFDLCAVGDLSSSCEACVPFAFESVLHARARFQHICEFLMHNWVHNTYTLDIAFQFKFYVIEPNAFFWLLSRIMSRGYASTRALKTIYFIIYIYLNDRKWMHAKYISFSHTRSNGICIVWFASAIMSVPSVFVTSRNWVLMDTSKLL